MKFDHLGYVTDNLQKTVESLTALGFEEMYDSPRLHNVKNMLVTRVRLGDFVIELMEVADKSKPSFIDPYVPKKGEPMVLQHICLDTTDITVTFDRLTTRGDFSVYQTITETIVRKGNKIGFLQNKQLGLVEFFQRFNDAQ